MGNLINDIIIACNKKDFFLTKICVASIRYFYSDVNIFLIKDYSNGNFDTKEIEKYYEVKILDLGIYQYGWSGAKMHVLISEKLSIKKYLSIDSDIVFCGPVLEHLSQNISSSDFVVSPFYLTDSEDKHIKETYYNIKDLFKIDPDFIYPGYVFNCGQMVITPRKLKYTDVDQYFDIDNFPRWKRLDIFPLVDQSLLNYILPKKEQLGEIKIAKIDFMLWSESIEAEALELGALESREGYPYLIHWAGALRTPLLSKMTRGDILSFFEDKYHSRIPSGRLRKYLYKLIPFINYQFSFAYRTLKKPYTKFVKTYKS